MLCYFCVIYVFYALVVLVRLSVPVQVIDWNLRNDLCCVDGDVNPLSLLTHSLTQRLRGIAQHCYNVDVSFLKEK